MTETFWIKFWGVRGTIPVPGIKTLKYGGNTSCVEMRCNDRQMIFDAGSGINELGLIAEDLHTDIFLSHTHLDHIMGLPTFKPLHHKDSNIALWAGHLYPEQNVQEVIACIMQSPIFPLTLENVASRVEFNDFAAGQCLVNSGLKKAGITIETLALNHPDKATGYRVNHQGKSACYITDIEHIDQQINEELLHFIDAADILIYDSTYDENEFEKHKGWGHSTWQHGAKLAQMGNVGQFIAFHHNPSCDDTMLDARQEALTQMTGNGIIAYEGLTIDLINNIIHTHPKEKEYV